jgi:hypothetical protein
MVLDYMQITGISLLIIASLIKRSALRPTLPIPLSADRETTMKTSMDWCASISPENAPYRP